MPRSHRLPRQPTPALCQRSARLFKFKLLIAESQRSVMKVLPLKNAPLWNVPDQTTPSVSTNFPCSKKVKRQSTRKCNSRAAHMREKITCPCILFSRQLPVYEAPSAQVYLPSPDGHATPGRLSGHSPERSRGGNIGKAA